MKQLCALVILLFGGAMFVACSDDGIYTPAEIDAGTDAPEAEQACQEKADCKDGG